MQGVLLESGSVDRYLALGKSGHPVSDAAQQILAVLQRHPQLQPFFAIPQRNQNGSVIDWYSPVQGSVIPWANASEGEKEQSRQALQAFTEAVGNLGAQHIQNAAKNGSADAGLFGQLLQEACKIPSAEHIYLVEMDGGKGSAHLGQSAAAVASSQASTLAEDDQAVRLQPVLTFWGFVNHEADRHRKPLYFLEPIPEKPAVVPAAVTGSVPLGEAATTVTEPIVTPYVPAEPPKVVPPIVVAQPWWKRWWLWLLLALLLLLLLWLLRGCMPTAKLPGFGGVQLPNVSLPSLPSGQLPDVTLPSGGLPTAQLPGLPAGQTVAGTAGLNGAGTGLEPEGAGHVGDSAQAAGLPVGAESEAAEQQPAPVSEPPLLPETQTAETPPVPPELPAQPGAEPANTPAPLEIPEKAADGVADFLNGKYRTRGGLVDQDTAQPLRLEYAFENGKGQVEIQRPNGVSCKGGVLASMKGGQLGIDSQGAAKCSDGSVYDMPQVQCKPGAKSAADCAGVYDNRQFPIQMQTN